MSIVCIGDSLTFGYGVDSKENWISVLSKLLNEEIINKGIPGNTTLQMKDRFFEDVVKLKPSKVFIMGGTNDLFLNEEFESILNNINSMIEMSKVNNISPIILTQLPINEKILVKTWFEDADYKLVNRKIDKSRDLLLQYAYKNEIKLIDLGNILINEGKIKECYLNDGIHVTKEIHNKIAEIIWNSKLLQ